MAESKERKEFSVLVCPDIEAISHYGSTYLKRFDMSLIASSTADIWGQVSEMLTMANVKLSDYSLRFTVVGLLGVRSKKEIVELSTHGSVLWRLPPKLAEFAEKEYTRAESWPKNIQVEADLY